MERVLLFCIIVLCVSCSIVHLNFMQPPSPLGFLSLSIVFFFSYFLIFSRHEEGEEEEETHDDDNDNVIDEEQEERVDQLATTTAATTTTSTTTTVATIVAGCSTEERAECEQICSSSNSTSNKSVVTCSCYRGFRLDADAKSCIGTFIIKLLFKCRNNFELF